MKRTPIFYFFLRCLSSCAAPTPPAFGPPTSGVLRPQRVQSGPAIDCRLKTLGALPLPTGVRGGHFPPRRSGKLVPDMRGPPSATPPYLTEPTRLYDLKLVTTTWLKAFGMGRALLPPVGFGVRMEPWACSFLQYSRGTPPSAAPTLPAFGPPISGVLRPQGVQSGPAIDFRLTT